MKQQHKDILIKNSLEKAIKALQDGQKNIDISLDVAQNRAYYAVFYIVLALGYLDGFSTGKHRQLMGWFNKKYVYQDKVFNPSLSKIYNSLMENRETFDYDVTQEPTKEDVLEDLKDAKTFIETVKPYILDKLNKESE